MTPIAAQETIDMFAKGSGEREDEGEQWASTRNLKPSCTMLLGEYTEQCAAK